MGNKVSAEASVNMKHAAAVGTPPPECPMHNKADTSTKPPPVASECPIQHDKANSNDINPYNMVSVLINNTIVSTYMGL